MVNRYIVNLKPVVEAAVEHNVFIKRRRIYQVELIIRFSQMDVFLFYRDINPNGMGVKYFFFRPSTLKTENFIKKIKGRLCVNGI